MDIKVESQLQSRPKAGTAATLRPIWPKDAKPVLCPNPPRSDFEGNWIWLPDKVGHKQRNIYVYFRRKFRAEGKLLVNIAADTFYDLFIDGKRVDRGTAVADVAYKIFDTHVVNILPGEHVVSVLVHHFGESCAVAMKSRPGLFLEMTTTSGKKIVTDGEWKVLPAEAFEQDLPCMMSHFGFYEVCDLRKVPYGWLDILFDDGDWYDAKVLGRATCKPWNRMIPRDIPLLATTQVSAEKVVCSGMYEVGPYDSTEEYITVAVEMAARKRKKTDIQMRKLPVNLAQGDSNGFAVIDFGREVSGHLRLGFSGAENGQQVDIGYDETLSESGYPDTRRTYVHFADRYYLRDGQNEIEVFNARGFRYLLIDTSAGRAGLALTKVQIDERIYPVARTGHFKCSNKAFEKLYQTGIDTIRLCMLDTYVDCPSRERVLWMDSYLEGIFSSYAMGITQLWRRVLYIFAQNTSRKGLLDGAVRGYTPSDNDPVLASYIMYYVCSVSDYLLHSGDFETCTSLLDTVTKQFEVLERFTTETGLLGDNWQGWGSFLDWSAMDQKGLSAGNNAIYIRMFQKGAVLAERLQKYNLATKLREKSDRLIKVFCKTFWMENEGLFADAIYDNKPSPVRSQLTNMLAIWSGIVDSEQGRSIIERITDEKVLLPRTKGDYALKSDFKPQVGGIVPIGTPCLGFLAAHIMFKLGMTCEALDYLEENWTPIGEHGTFSEHFVFDVNTSFCHGWSAGPVALLPRFVLGVRPISPGWKEVEICPQAGNLEWAEGTVPTPQGDIHVKWKKVAGELELWYEVPKGITVVNR